MAETCNVDYLPEGADVSLINYNDKPEYHDTYADMPLFYYRGYKAFDAAGNELQLEKGDNGRIRVIYPKGTDAAGISVKYCEPWYFTACAWISIAVIIILGILQFKNRRPVLEMTDAEQIC